MSRKGRWNREYRKMIRENSIDDPGATRAAAQFYKDSLAAKGKAYFTISEEEFKAEEKRLFREMLLDSRFYWKAIRYIARKTSEYVLNKIRRMLGKPIHTTVNITGHEAPDNR